MKARPLPEAAKRQGSRGARGDLSGRRVAITGREFQRSRVGRGTAELYNQPLEEIDAGQGRSPAALNRGRTPCCWPDLDELT